MAPVSPPAAMPCTRPPLGWRCRRTRDHDGPCAAVPVFYTVYPTTFRLGGVVVRYPRSLARAEEI